MANVAVVIPCYNQGRTVGETVASVLAQTRPAAEVVVVNDGSTDVYTRQLLRTTVWPRVTIVETANAGLPAARNAGIRLTSAEYLVTLDADDMLEPAYLERTGAVLDRDESVGFVTTAIHGFGEADYVWTPPPCDLVTAFTRGTAHPASLFRRRLWEAVGGFDEHTPIHGVEDQDFWISAMARGFKGEVLPDVLMQYRVTARSMHQRNVRSGAHLRAVEALLAKHRAVVEHLGVDVLAAKEAFYLELLQHSRHLASRQQALRREADVLDQRIREAADRLRAAGRDAVEWGDLRRLTPLSRIWGLDRGKPLDRYYIEGFLERHRTDIRGSVLEMKDPGYTRAYGADVTRSDVLDIDTANPQATIVADLTQADGIVSDSFDCFILTQTLPFIFDVRAALSHACRILKPGGVLLCTVPASGRISYEDDGIDGDYWRFTEASMRRLFADVFPLEQFEVDVRGNILSNVAFLYGLAPDELRREELDHTDPYFPVIITVRAVKPGDQARRAPVKATAAANRTDAGSTGAILLYHRVPRIPDDDRTAVDVGRFQAQMEYLRRKCHPMTLQDLAGAASRGTIPARAVTVTVDDGGIDSLEVVSPIALEIGIPITFFLDTDRLDEEHERWWDIVPRILLGDSPLPESLTVRLEGELRRFGTATASERRAAWAVTQGALIKATLEERTALVQHLVDWSGLDLAPRRSRRALTSPEVRQLAAAGHDIGAHTVHHLSLIAQTREVRMREIAESKRALEALVDRPVNSFAYPYGHHDDECADLVRAAGFSCAVVVDGNAVTASADLVRLSRIEVGNWDIDEFERCLGSRLLETT